MTVVIHSASAPTGPWGRLQLRENGDPNPQTCEQDSQFVSVAECASRTGLQVRYIRQCIADGTVPALRRDTGRHGRLRYRLEIPVEFIDRLRLRYIRARKRQTRTITSGLTRNGIRYHHDGSTSNAS